VSGFSRTLFESVDCADVWMLERGKDLRFALKPGEPFCVAGERVRQDLQRNIARQPRVTGTIDLAHAAGAERAGDLVRADPRADGQ